MSKSANPRTSVGTAQELAAAGETGQAKFMTWPVSDAVTAFLGWLARKREKDPAALAPLAPLSIPDTKPLVQAADQANAAADTAAGQAAAAGAEVVQLRVDQEKARGEVPTNDDDLAARDNTRGRRPPSG